MVVVVCLFVCLFVGWLVGWLVSLVGVVVVVVVVVHQIVSMNNLWPRQATPGTIEAVSSLLARGKLWQVALQQEEVESPGFPGISLTDVNQGFSIC